MSFANLIIIWYNANKRDLPWRDTVDPYKIWLAEIIMQQTRVEQGLPYYLRFCDHFPEVKDLALASLDEVLKLWQGLGYYTRARNLYETAGIVYNRYHGNFPSTYAGLLELKGIGDYSASAIASIAFGLPHPVIDGNVIRFISRYLALSIPVGKKELKQEIRSFLIPEIAKESPAMFNQALMEIGGMVCKPQNPDCTKCPVSAGCMARNLGITAQFPVKSPKVNVRNRYFLYLVIQNPKSGIILKKRTGRDIWKGLFDFPLIELPGPPDSDLLQYIPEIESFLNPLPFVLKKMQGPLLHLLSHQKLHCWFLDIQCDFDDSFRLEDNYLLTFLPEISRFPVPRLIEKYIHDFLKY